MNWRLAWLFIAGFAAACSSGSRGCATGYGVEVETNAASRFANIRNHYFFRSLQFNPVTATYLGADGYMTALRDINGRLRDDSPEALEEELAYYQETQKALSSVSFDDLPPALRVDYRVIDAQLKFLIRQIGERKYHERAVDTYVTEPFRGIDWQLQQMEDAGSGRRGTEAEWKLVIARIEAIPAYLKRALQNLQAGRDSGNLPDYRMVQRDGVEGSRANAEYFGKTLLRDGDGYISGAPFAAELLSRLHTASTLAAAAWEEFAAGLQIIYDARDNADRFAAGRQEYEWRVHNLMNDRRSSNQLFEYGAQQVALYDSKIQEVAKQLARDGGLRLNFGDAATQAASVRAVISHLSKDSPASDDELFAWYRDTAQRAVSYGRGQQMFDVPADYTLEILPTPPILRAAIDAVYYPAPPFKKSGAGRFYLTPTDNNPASLRLNNRSSIADTAVHEGFPGHDWHYRFMKLHNAEISNIRWLTPGAVEDSSAMWSDSMAAEGWGLYAEELMSEPVAGRPYGFYSAAEYLYELQGQMMRAVRVRVDVGIHTGRTTYNEARDYFTEHVYFHPGACASQDPDARATCDLAERAIYRYSKWPTQAITYNLGKTAIIALREAYKEKTGTAYSPKSFHEKLMRMGTVPATYFRDEFLVQ